MPNRILALDLGTRCGWSFRPGTGTVYSGVQDFSLKRGESSGMRFLNFDVWLTSMLVQHQPQLIVYEAAHHRGGYATALLVGMAGILQKVCAAQSREYTSVHSATLKKFATGSGRASKEDMIAKACELFKKESVIDDNEADALLMIGWAIKEYKCQKNNQKKQ
ncbi:hypothetical protein KAR91_76370 [Candidatus Pacearchaeota archaeon]|nr:hypothetical protein [Candidatus Pacearchaeota archaeon]